MSEPVTKPAPEVPAPPAAAYIGVTDSSRKKLVSAPKEAISRSAKRLLMSRARGAGGLADCLAWIVWAGCSAWVTGLTSLPVGAKWATGKVQSDGHSVGRFGARTVAAARSRPRTAAAVAARGRTARSDQMRPAGEGPSAPRLPLA